jgi:hypothetical protein
MRDRSTYPMSALFLLVTIVAVLVGVASSGISQWLKIVPMETFGVPLAAAAIVLGLLGPIVMAYQTRNWGALVLSYYLGTAISALALRMLFGPNSMAVAAAGAAILVGYAVVIRFLQPPTSDAPTSGGGEVDTSPKR